MIFDAVFPIPIYYYRKRAKKAQWVFRQGRTVVDIPETDPDNVRLVWQGKVRHRNPGMNLEIQGVLKPGDREIEDLERDLGVLADVQSGRLSLVEWRDVLWVAIRRLDEADARRELTEKLIEPDMEFEALLARSPLVSMFGHIKDKPLDDDALQLREIVHDWSERCTAELHSFCQDRLAIAGRFILVRAWEPMLGIVSVDNSDEVIQFAPGNMPLLDNLWRLDRRGDGTIPIHIPPHLLGNDDIRFRSNRLVSYAHANLEQLAQYFIFLTRSDINSRDKKPLLADLEWIRPLAMAAALGGLDLGSAHAIIDRLRTFEHAHGFFSRVSSSAGPEFLNECKNLQTLIGTALGPSIDPKDSDALSF